MGNAGNCFLIIGAALSAIAALLHLGCIVVGAPGYRFFRAGKRMAQAASAGRWYPAAVTLAIVPVLVVRSLYALSGARVIGSLPFLRFALCAITAIYILRDVALIPLVSCLPRNSMSLWVVSSAVCPVFGIVHPLALTKRWRTCRTGEL